MSGDSDFAPSIGINPPAFRMDKRQHGTMPHNRRVIFHDKNVSLERQVLEEWPQTRLRQPPPLVSREIAAGHSARNSAVTSWTVHEALAPPLTLTPTMLLAMV